MRNVQCSAGRALVGGVGVFWARPCSDELCCQLVVHDLYIRTQRVLAVVSICGAHGLILARPRANRCQKRQSVLSYFSKWRGIAKNLDVLSSSVRANAMTGPFTWHRTPRPDEEIAAADFLKESLLKDTDALYQQGTQSMQHKSKLHLALGSTFSCIQNLPD